MELTVWHNIYLKMISWQTAAHWPYVEAPFPFYLVFYDRATDRPQVAALRGRSYAEGGAQLPADSWYWADVMLSSMTSLSFQAET